MKPAHLIAVAVGGVIGALVRWGVVEVLPSDPVIWGTLVVNTVGSFFLGAIMAKALHPKEAAHPFATGAGAGFCGSLTTFSALSVSVARDLQEGAITNAGVVLGLSIALGLGAAWAGWHLAEYLTHRNSQALR